MRRPCALTSPDSEHKYCAACTKANREGRPLKCSLISRKEESGSKSSCRAVNAVRQPIWSRSGFPFGGQQLFKIVQTNRPVHVAKRLPRKRQYHVGLVTRNFGFARPEDTAPVLTQPVSSLTGVENRNITSARNCVLLLPHCPTLVATGALKPLQFLFMCTNIVSREALHDVAERAKIDTRC